MTTTDTVPDSPTALLDKLGSGEFRADTFANPAKAKQFMDDYVRSTLKADPVLAQDFASEQQRGILSFLREQGLGNTAAKQGAQEFYAGRSKLDKGERYNSKAPGAKLDDLFEGSVDDRARDFFQGTWKNFTRFSDREKLATLRNKIIEVQNAYGSNVPSDGGFLIPEILRSQILMLSLEDAIVRPRATVIPMDSLKVPIPTVDETSRVSSIWGGIIGYWTAEGAPLQDSSAKFGQVTLDAKKLTLYAAVPNELFADAPGFGGFFNNTFPQAVTYFEDLAFLTGDGIEQPLGVLNGSGVIGLDRTTANAVIYDDLVKMYSRMLPQSIRNAVWVVSHDVFPQLAELTFTPAGGTPVPVMLWQPNAVGEPTYTILGRPVIVSEKIGPLGSTGDVQFLDFAQYLLGDRQAMAADSSSDYLFGNDKTAFRIIERVDGRPWMQTALTPHNGGPTLSPYVVLDVHS